jgi:uncharacterized protein YdaU (DUF1376 family)
MADKAPAFQFYPKDFLSDERVRLMSHTERGIYITLLCLCWLEGTLPLETDKLAKLVEMPLPRFTKVWENSVLRQCFQVNDDGRLHHKRLDEERVKQDHYRRGQSDKGKASGVSRRATKGPQDTNHGSTAVQPSAVQPNTNSSSPISNLHSPEEERSRARGATVFDGALPRDHRNHVFCDDTYAVCVPSMVHAKLLTLLSRRYPERGAAHKALTEWYAVVAARQPAAFVMGDAFKFWQAQFDAEFATPVETMKSPVNPHEDAEKVRDLLRRMGA